jgi:hypothetical protein
MPRGGVSPPGAGPRKEQFRMRSSRSLILAAAGLGALALGLATGPTTRAQGPSGSVLADALPPIIPLHHHHLWFSFQYNSANPTSGFLIALQLNNSGGNCTETLPLPKWLNCRSGEVASLSNGAGTATGTFGVSETNDGWTRYQADFRVRNAFTQIWDVSRKMKVAVGYSSFNGQVSYEREVPVSPEQDSFIYSVLGPVAHAWQYPNIGLRSFFFHADVSGTGQSLRLPGQPAQWSLSSIFMQNNDLAIGRFGLTP